MNRLLALLIRFLRLGVEDEGDPVDPPVDAAETPDTAATTTGDDTLDDLIESVEPTPQATKPSDDSAAAIRRAEAAERALADERASRPAPRTGSDPDYEREEAQLAQERAAGASQERLSWLQWQIDSNRKMRSSERKSESALQQAREIADKADFDRLEITKPKVYKAYSGRIEKTISDMRARGEVIPPRAMLLRVFLGDDIMNGKIKPKVAAKSTTTDTTTVDRGRTPSAGARSDARGGRGGQTEHDKRRARLENQVI
jgi:hypothetical protein